MTLRDNYHFGPVEESAVMELSNIGLGHAVTSLSEMTGRSFSMSVPSVTTVGLEAIPDLVGDPDALTVSIYMAVEGDVTGHLAFLFPWDSAQSLWRMVLGASPETIDDVDPLAASAILEIGNIINSSFLNAISDMCDLKLHATPPLVSVDSCAAIVGTITAEAEMADALALSVETAIFEHDNKETRGYFLCIPTLEGLNLIFQRLGIQEAA